MITLLPGLALGLMLAGCDRQKAPDPQGGAPTATASEGAAGGLDRSRAGTPAPDIEFQDPEGRPVTLAEFRGRPVLVNLWATWCAPCVVEMPSLDALAARSGDRLQVLAISQDHQGREKVEQFFTERRLTTLEPYLDEQLAFMTELEVATLPTTILYDAQGREVWRMTGIEEWDGERAAALIAEAQRS